MKLCGDFSACREMKEGIKRGLMEKIKNLKLGFTTFQPLLSDRGGAGIKMMTRGSSLERCTRNMSYVSISMNTVKTKEIVKTKNQFFFSYVI